MLEILGVKVSLWGLYGLASMQAMVAVSYAIAWMLRKDKDGWIAIPIVIGAGFEIAIVIIMMNHAGMQP